MNRIETTSTPHPLEILASASARDLRSLQIKLTFVGPHKAPLPSVVFSSCYHLVDLDWFTALADPALSYANDAVALMNFAAAPEELVDVIAAVAAEHFTRQVRAAAPVLALDLVLKESRVGDAGAAFVLAAPEALTAARAIAGALSRANGVGRDVMGLFETTTLGARPQANDPSSNEPPPPGRTATQ